MKLDVEATIDGATVTAPSVSMIATSTQDAGLPGDKIATLAVGAAFSGDQSALGASVAVNAVTNTIHAGAIDASKITADGGRHRGDRGGSGDDRLSSSAAPAIAPGSDGIGFGIGANYIGNNTTAEVTGATADAWAGGNVAISATEAATIEGIVIGLWRRQGHRRRGVAGHRRHPERDQSADRRQQRWSTPRTTSR